ncbi:MAG: 3-oxo-tetronate 4-phosphate decarboxylase [Calditrichaeota bacterium]|nr:3-oxo-tetronate 4-phosphate decarboxylase [Calditrichota bacterium]
MIEAGKRLDVRGLIAGFEGNMSALLPERTVLISASGSALGRLVHKDFVTVDANSGEVLEGTATASSELDAHLAAYRTDDSIGAVIHAHPKSCITLTLRGWTLEAVPLPEAAYTLGSVPTCRFAVPGTPEGGEVVAHWASRRDAILFDRHGAITFGATVDDALARMEMLDAVAEIVLRAGGPENVKPLTAEEVERVAGAARGFGVRREALDVWIEAMSRRA